MAITNLTGYKWYGNDTLDIPTLEAYNVILKTAGKSYAGLVISSAFGDFNGLAVLDDLSENIVLYDDGEWVSEDRRTIFFAGGMQIDDANLIEWLEDNGTLTQEDSNSIVIKSKAFTDEDIVSGDVMLTNGMIGDELTIDEFTCTVMVDNGEISSLLSFSFGEPVEYRHGGKLIGKFFLNKIQRVGKNTLKISAVSIIGILERTRHYGGIYSLTKASDILSDILTGITYTVSQEVGDTALSGWLPIGTARANLHKVLFAIGASLIKKADGSLQIIYMNQPVASDIPDTRIAVGGSVTAPEKVTEVNVTAHSYYASNEEATIFDNSQGTLASHLKIEFREPYHDLSASGLTIEESGVNYAIVSGIGTLTGKKYIHTENVVTYFSDDVGDEVKSVAVTDDTLISNVNALQVSKRLAAYYNEMRNVSNQIIVGDERPASLVNFNDPFGDESTGYLEELNINISKQLVAGAKYAADWTPRFFGNNYSHSVVLTQSGTWTVPADAVGKPALVVLFGGAQGGQGGYKGANGSRSDMRTTFTYNGQSSWISDMYIQNGEGGEGGNGGQGGAAGNFIMVEIDELASSYPVTLGEGGEGGAAEGGEGSPGTDSTFGSFSTSLGTPFTGDYVNLITGAVYGSVGLSGIKGGKGGSIHTETVAFSGSVFNVPDTVYFEGVGSTARSGFPKGGDGEAVGNYTGGIGYTGQYVQYSGSEFVNDTGGCGGGASATANGNNAVHLSFGDGRYPGGNGADASKPAKATMARGGHGGHGGGGGGASGTEMWRLPESYFYRSAVGQGGNGSQGGDGSDGIAVIYY